MRAQRLSPRLLLPAGLILLVVLLGTLQYRWLGQVSEAERAQLQRSLAQRANEFGVEFDREIALVYELLTIESTALEGDVWSVMTDRYDTWRGRALYPDLVRALYVARSTTGGHTLARWTPDARTGTDIDWPDHFGDVRQAIALSAPRSVPPVPVTAVTAGTAMTTQARVGAVYTMALSPVVDSVPALILPIATRHHVASPDPALMVAVRSAGTDFVIVELNRTVLTESLIPALVERFFPSDDANRYRVAIVDRAHERVFARDFAVTSDDRELHLDAMAAFFTGSRFEFTARMLTESRLLAWQVETTSRNVVRQTQSVPLVPGTVSVMVRESGPVPSMAAPRMAAPGWQIMLQHGTGSLDEAVARARIRNLTTSFGILAVLIAGVGLIVANARKSERLAAQQIEFVATVSHELRTPLAVIRSAAQNLSAGVVEDPAQARRYGELIETEGRRLTDMVEEVLEFAGLSGNRRTLALRPVDLAWLVRDVLATQTAALSALGIEADVTTDADLPMVMVDEEAIRRALTNLIANAAKYAADGRWIGIRITRTPGGTHDEVRLAVSDRGQGIDAQDLPHLFEPFYRGREVAARQIHGNGLGLSLVARIAEAHGGRVTVDSTPGAGATFTLHLPATPALPTDDVT
jgi:two-component system sensor histidine kinase SenX3